MSDLNAAFVAAHRGNIDRYRRLLRTRLTDHERTFIERRLAEERAALDALLGKRRARSIDSPIRRASRSTVIAADALTSRGGSSRSL